MPRAQVNFKEYLFTIESLQDNKVNISATHSNNGDVYFVNDLTLKQIQSSCIIPAMENKQSQNLNLQAILKYQGLSSATMELEIIVKYEFIKEMKESIVLIKKQSNEEQKHRNILKQAQKNLDELTEKLKVINNQRKVAVKKEVTNYGLNNTNETLLSLQLPPGDYEITFSLFVKPDNRFIDLQFYIDGSKTDGIPGGVIYLNKNAGNQFYPITVKTVVSLNKQAIISVVTQAKQSQSQFQAKEQILIAERITDLVDTSKQLSLWEKYKNKLGTVTGVITVAGGILALLLALLL